MIRAATGADAAAIGAIWNHYIRETAVTFNSREKSAEEVARMISDRPCTLVAEADGAVAGFVTYDQFRGGVGYAFSMEHTILVDPATAGHGHGGRLIAAAVDHARAGGVHSLWAGVSAENPAGVSFHQRHGFEAIATLPEVGRKFDRWMDLVLLRKAL